MLEPSQLATLKAIEVKIGVPVSEQIRRALDVYLRDQKVLTKAEVKRVTGGD